MLHEVGVGTPRRRVDRLSRTLGVGLSILGIAAGATLMTPGTAEAKLPSDPIASLCDGDPDLEYTPSGDMGGRIAEGACRSTAEAVGRASAAVGRTARDCLLPDVGDLLDKGPWWKKAGKIAKFGAKKVSPLLDAAECAKKMVD